MALHQLQPRGHRLPVQFLQFGQFDACHVLEHDQHGALVDLAGTDLRVAMRTILQDQIVRGNRCPELKIVHGRQPGFDLINVLKVFHASILPSMDKRLQIPSGKRGKP